MGQPVTLLWFGFVMCQEQAALSEAGLNLIRAVKVISNRGRPFLPLLTWVSTVSFSQMLLCNHP